MFRTKTLMYGNRQFRNEEQTAKKVPGAGPLAALWRGNQHRISEAIRGLQQATLLPLTNGLSARIVKNQREPSSVDIMGPAFKGGAGSGRHRSRSSAARKAAAVMPSATKTLLVFSVALAAGSSGRVAAAGGRDLGISAREVLGEASRSVQERSRSIQREILHGFGRSGPDLVEHGERGRSLSPASSAERLVAVAAVVENLALFKRWKFKQRSQLEMAEQVESKEEVGSGYKLLETGLKDNVLRPGLPLTTFMSLGRQLLHKHDRDRAGADCAVCLGGEDEDDEEEGVAIGPDATASLASEGAYKRKVLEMLTLPCGHLFHTVCAARWFHRDASCPTCRRQVASLADRSVTIQIVAGALKSAKSLGVFAGSMIKAVCHPVARLLLPRKGRGGGWVLAMLPLLSKKAA